MESPLESLRVVDSFVAGSFVAGITERGPNSVEVQLENLQAKLRPDKDEDEKLPSHLKRLFLYCSLFPSGYEFRKDELIQLWIAEGFIRERRKEKMEDTASEHFNYLKEEGFFLTSRCDITMDFNPVLSAPPDEPSNFLYRVSPIKQSLLEDAVSSGNYFKAVDGNLDGDSAMTRHLSLISEDTDGMTLRILQNFKQLRSLHLLPGCGSSMKHVPRYLCFTLTFLRTLNLSGTSINELPSSIGNVKSLRYVDASHTPLARLPESINSLHNLQTIKLRGCLYFAQLPKGMKKLTKLRHIDLDIIRQLNSLPAYLGNLSDLQTLPSFFIGRDDGCHVSELKNLNGLKGAFTILRLENVSSEEEAEETALGDKKGIHRLELRWSNLFAKDAELQEKILENLHPHFGLKELQIQLFSGSILPTWISNPSFAYLVVITLYRCTNCKVLPCMGQLPALKSLCMIEVNELNEVKEINHHFLRTAGSLDHAFPKLERLEVDVMLNLEEWKGIHVGGFPSLVKLIVDYCPKLVTVPALSRLKSLKHLELKRCPKLMSFPSDGLPASIESLIVVDCLELKKWCLNCDHWNMFCHLPSIWFDHEEGKPIIEEDGKTVHNNVVEAIEKHRVLAYPFTPEKFEELFEIYTAKENAQTLESILISEDRNYVIRKDGTEIPVSDLVGKNILLYFSAHWCAPCRASLPKLLEAYHKAKDKAFEVIVISSDSDQESFERFFSGMPWLALPFGDTRNASLRSRFKIEGIPILALLVAPAGQTVAKIARYLLHGAGEDMLKEIEAEIEELAKRWPKKLMNAIHAAGQTVAKIARYLLHLAGEDITEVEAETEELARYLFHGTGEDKTEVEAKTKDGDGEDKTEVEAETEELARYLFHGAGEGRTKVEAETKDGANEDRTEVEAKTEDGAGEVRTEVEAKTEELAKRWPEKLMNALHEKYKELARYLFHGVGEDRTEIEVEIEELTRYLFHAQRW